jgi:Ca2+-transporting ATPase
VHVAFFEMVIEPVCSLVFEVQEQEQDVTRRPPRPPVQPLFTPVLVVWSLLQGGLVFATGRRVSGRLLARLARRRRPGGAFISLVAAIVSLIFVNRWFLPGSHSRKKLWTAAFPLLRREQTPSTDV